jgi:Raf kinase inhibitor-like YbhB/YbcL family protein
MIRSGILIAALLCLAFSSFLLFATEAPAASRIYVESGAFKDGAMMPEAHAFDKDNISPEISWSGIPEGARTIALICEDPDAPSGNWVHWIVYNIPASSSGIPEGVPAEGTIGGGAMQGINDFKKIGYDGPYPPYGTHRYVFRVYALDKALGLEPGADRESLLRAMEGHVLAEGALTGRYKR